LGGADGVTIQFPGVLNTGGSSVFWGGLNDSAMLVKGGVYTIKAEITDNFGQVTSLIKVVQVVPGGAQQLLRIFNSAGETVREIPLAAVPGANRMNLPAESYALELDASGAVLNPLTGDTSMPNISTFTGTLASIIHSTLPNYKTAI
jgi:hypothetical protein